MGGSIAHTHAAGPARGRPWRRWNLPLETQDVMIAIVDDDRSIRTSLARLMRSAGYDARAFANSEEYLNDVDGAALTYEHFNIGLGRALEIWSLDGHRIFTDRNVRDGKFTVIVRRNGAYE